MERKRKFNILRGIVMGGFLTTEIKKELIDFVNELEEAEQEIRNKAIDEFAEKICEHCMKQTNCCNPLECPFCRDGCAVVKIANEMKGE